MLCWSRSRDRLLALDNLIARSSRASCKACSQSDSWIGVDRLIEKKASRSRLTYRRIFGYVNACPTERVDRMAFAICRRNLLRRKSLLRLLDFPQHTVSILVVIQGSSVISQYTDGNHFASRFPSSTRFSGEPHLRIFMCITTGPELMNCHYKCSF